MPMIDVYAAAGTFADEHQLAVDLASALMKIEKVPDITLFRANTAAFVHQLPGPTLANVDGDSTHVRVQVLTNAGALDRDSSWPWSASSPPSWPPPPEIPRWPTAPGSCSPRPPTAAGAWPATPTPTKNSSKPPARSSPASSRGPAADTQTRTGGQPT